MYTIAAVMCSGFKPAAVIRARRLESASVARCQTTIRCSGSDSPAFGGRPNLKSRLTLAAGLIACPIFLIPSRKLPLAVSVRSGVISYLHNQNTKETDWRSQSVLSNKLIYRFHELNRDEIPIACHVS